MIRAFLAAALLCAVSSCGMTPAFAAKLHPQCNIDWPCAGADHLVDVNKMIRADRREARRIARGRELERRMPIGMALERGESPSGFIRGRLVCAKNVNAALAARGIRGTGSALAKSFLSWGRASGPVPGAVAVFSRGKRGGHTAIVHDVKPDGTVIYLNPSSRRQAWQVGPYNRRPIAFRVAG